MNSMSVGVDIVDIDRFRRIKSSGFYKKVFTKSEISYCKSKKDCYSHLAARFAAKEAVKKAIKENLDFREIEVKNRPKGAPYIIIKNENIKRKYEPKISLSHSKDLAIAFCIVHGE